MVVDHVRGGHHILVPTDDPERMLSVPVHAGKVIEKGTLKAILEQAGLTSEEFRRFL